MDTNIKFFSSADGKCVFCNHNVAPALVKLTLSSFLFFSLCSLFLYWSRQLLMTDLTIRLPWLESCSFTVSKCLLWDSEGSCSKWYFPWLFTVLQLCICSVMATKWACVFTAASKNTEEWNKRWWPQPVSTHTLHTPISHTALAWHHDQDKHHSHDKLHRTTKGIKIFSISLDLNLR